jgi:hypothetical protein
MLENTVFEMRKTYELSIIVMLWAQYNNLCVNPAVPALKPCITVGGSEMFSCTFFFSFNAELNVCINVR